MEWQSSSSYGPKRGVDNVKCITLLHRLRAYKMTVSASPILHIPYTQAHVTGSAVHVYFRIRLFSLPLSLFSHTSLSPFFRFYSLSFIARYWLLFAPFFRNPPRRGGSPALTHRGLLRIIARSNRPNDSLASLFIGLYLDALHLPLHIEFENKRATWGLWRRRWWWRRAAVVIALYIYTYRQFRRPNSHTRRIHRSLYFLSLLQPVFPASATSICLFSASSVSSIGFRSHIPTPFVRRFVSSLIFWDV